MHFGKLLYILSNELRKHSVETGSLEELTVVQTHILKYILLCSLECDLCQKDIEEEFQIKKSTVSQMLKLMEKNGFIVRCPSAEDARRKIIIPTEKSESIRTKLMEELKEVETAMKKDIPKKDLETCEKVMRKMVNNMIEFNEMKRNTEKLN